MLPQGAEDGGTDPDELWIGFQCGLRIDGTEINAIDRHKIHQQIALVRLSASFHCVGVNEYIGTSSTDKAICAEVALQCVIASATVQPIIGVAAIQQIGEGRTAGSAIP